MTYKEEPVMGKGARYPSQAPSPASTQGGRGKHRIRTKSVGESSQQQPEEYLNVCSTKDPIPQFASPSPPISPA